MEFNHFDSQGQAIMVDVSGKQPTERTAIAQTTVSMQAATLELIRTGTAKKGDVLGVARLAGIMASKKTPDMIPLAHPLAIHAVAIEFALCDEPAMVKIRAQVTAVERTGVEMEAMLGASMAALTLYDMCKGVDRSMTIEQTCLLYKSGGRSGVYERTAEK
jgi:cyclic pyranopterin phosphate synthase